MAEAVRKWNRLVAPLGRIRRRVLRILWWGLGQTWLYGNVDQSFQSAYCVSFVSPSVFVWPPGVGHQISG